MSNEKERISAYLDDGLSSEEVEAMVSAGTESESGMASRYQMIGEVLRGKLSDVAMNDISAQVREALRGETPLSDERPARQHVKRDRQPMFDFTAWFRPLGGLAVAASVALVMVVAVTQVESPSGKGGLVADAGNPVVNVPDTAVAVATRQVQPRDKQAVNLDAYLAEHAEFSAQDTLQGRMPYVRAVSYESNQ
jgi:negative regulator of sigma E activity